MTPPSQPSALRAVIFDMGGVLLHEADPRPRRELADRLDVPLAWMVDLVFNTETSRRATRGEIPVTEHWEAVRQALGLDPEGMAEFHREFWRGDAIDQNMIGFVRTLRPAYLTGLLSNAWDDARPVLTTRWGFADLFDDMVFSAEVGLAKPDLRIYQLALQRLGVEPSQALFVDDILENVEAARAAGMQAFQYHNSQQAVAEVLGALRGETV